MRRQIILLNGTPVLHWRLHDVQVIRIVTNCILVEYEGSTVIVFYGQIWRKEIHICPVLTVSLNLTQHICFRVLLYKYFRVPGVCEKWGALRQQNGICYSLCDSLCTMGHLDLFPLIISHWTNRGSQHWLYKDKAVTLIMGRLPDIARGKCWLPCECASLPSKASDAPGTHCQSETHVPRLAMSVPHGVLAAVSACVLELHWLRCIVL